MSNWPEGWTRGPRPPRSPYRDPEPTVYSPNRPAPAPPPPPPTLRDPYGQQQTRPGGPGDPYDLRPVEPAPRPYRIGPSRGARIRRTILVLLVILVLLLVGLYFYIDSKLTKVNALHDYANRPAPTPGQTWLLVGSDSRQGMSRQQMRDLHTGFASGSRTDSIMLMHISRGGGATLISLPRDSMVEIPAHPNTDGSGEHIPAATNKLNAAFSLGGPSLLARTVEHETGLRIDRYMEIGFGGFVNIVDAVGGVKMCLPEPIQDQKAGANLPKGCHRFDGAESLSFVRARYFDPTGDFGRVQRQRQFLRALSKEVSSPSTLLNPITMTKVMNSGLGSLKVDRDTGPISLGWFAWKMKGLAGGKGTTITVPVAGTETNAELGSVVVWDRTHAIKLFNALKADRPVPKTVRQFTKQQQ